MSIVLARIRLRLERIRLRVQVARGLAGGWNPHRDLAAPTRSGCPKCKVLRKKAPEMKAYALRVRKVMVRTLRQNHVMAPFQANAYA